MSLSQLKDVPHSASSDEIETLRQQLQESNGKLERWKLKAQEGVNLLRQQVIELSKNLETSQNRVRELEQRGGSVGLPFHSPSLLEECLVEKCDILASTVAECYPWRALMTESDNYRRHTSLTLRLQTKNCETLQREASALQTSLSVCQKTLDECQSQLKARDDMIGVLEKRLEDADNRLDRIHQEEASRYRGANMEQINQLEEDKERQVQELRDEFASRESAIFLQHADEISRLNGRHERELRALRQSVDQRVEDAIREWSDAHQASTGTEHVGSATGKDSGDDAYIQLSHEYADLERRLQEAERENEHLRQAAKRTRLPETHESRDPETLEESRAALQEALRKVQAVTAQNVQLKGEVRQLAAERSEQRAKEGMLPEGALDAQQVLYLKSVLVTALCSLREEKVIQNVLPVFATLLALSEAEVAAIYKSNPSWVHR